MIIHHSDLESHFVQVPNETARDSRLSYRARGVLAELLSHRDGWDATTDSMWRRAKQPGGSGEGRDALRAVQAELAAAGYTYWDRRRDSRGRFVHEMHVFDTPEHLKAWLAAKEWAAVDNQSPRDISAGQTSDGLSGAGTTWANMYRRRSHQRRLTRPRFTRPRFTRPRFTRRRSARRLIEDQERRPLMKTRDRNHERKPR